MGKELEQYKQALRLQSLFFMAGTLVMLGLIVLSGLKIILPRWGDPAWQGVWNGFISGCSTALAVLMALGVVRNTRALRDEERLRRLYIKTHDERTREIFHRAGHISYWFDAFGLLIAAIVAGYFHPAVALACLGCTLYVCLVRLALKLYYAHVL